MSESTKILLRSVLAWAALASLIASAGMRLSIGYASQQDIWLAAAFCGTR
jgi:hypothetical protein